MASIAEKIAELESQIAKTQKNKATEWHLASLKAKIAKLRKDQMGSGGKGGGGGSGAFDVKKAGNASVVFIGLPSVGKSTLLNALTGSKSKTASYAFTTLTVVPGILHYKGAQIQLLDLPGIISGASKGRGKGRQVLAVARNADLIFLVVDVFHPDYVEHLKEELADIGIRLDQEPVDIAISLAGKGGLNIVYNIKPTHLNDKIIESVLNEYGIYNATVVVREDATVDQLIDLLVGNRRYAPSLIVLNKVDLATKETFAKLPKGEEYVAVSAESGKGIEELKEALYRKLRLIRVFTKSKFDTGDDVPLMLREGTTVGDACEKLHRDLRSLFKFARVWGPSAKHPGQRVGLEHKLMDGDTFIVEKR